MSRYSAEFKPLSPSEAGVLSAVSEFLVERGFGTSYESAGRGSSLALRVRCNSIDGLPVTVRLTWMDGDLVGLMAGTTDALGLLEHSLQNEDFPNKMRLNLSAQEFDVCDPAFFDQLLDFVKDPLKYLSKGGVLREAD